VWTTRFFKYFTAVTVSSFFVLSLAGCNFNVGKVTGVIYDRPEQAAGAAAKSSSPIDEREITFPSDMSAWGDIRIEHVWTAGTRSDVQFILPGALAQ
jgi:hypothetical protein